MAESAYETIEEIKESDIQTESVKVQDAKQPLIWRNIIGIAVLHILAVYSFATRYHEAKFWTWIWSLMYGISAGLGITAGAHRLWAHRSYSAKLPLRILLAYLYCMAGQVGNLILSVEMVITNSMKNIVCIGGPAFLGTFYTLLSLFLSFLALNLHNPVISNPYIPENSGIAGTIFRDSTHLYKWIRDHRTHHRYTETSADPHNANRGFFFSHVGWLMMKRHPAVKEYGSKVDMSDIAADPVIRFTDRYYPFIMSFLCFVLPTLVPIYLWGETWYVSVHAVIIRYVWSLNATFLVNSFAHMWGTRPYNRKVKPAENSTVAFFTLGEGWHNYHHSFPWDYKAAELGAYSLNPTTAFIEIMSWLGLAYNLKVPNKSMIEKLIAEHGDGSKKF